MGSKILISTRIFIGAGSTLLTLIITLLCIGFMVKYEVITDVSSVETVSYWKDRLSEEQTIWYDNGINELQVALNLIPTEQKVKNVVIYIVNGVDSEALAAFRFSQQLRKNIDLTWDKFDYIARLQNSCSKSDMCDASSASTAMFGGIKTNYGVGGFDSAVSFRNCSAFANKTHQVSSILRRAQELGMRTGFVTTGRVTAPFMAPLYAHTPDSNWECESTMPHGLRGVCIDVGEQLINGKTGQHLNVIMGGGRQTLLTNIPETATDPVDDVACRSKENHRNLIRDWQQNQILKKRAFTVAHNTEELNAMNGSLVDYAFGVFANGNLNSQKTNLTNMVAKSAEVLCRQDSGFMLIVNTMLKYNESRSVQIDRLFELNNAIEKNFENSCFSNENTLTLIVFTYGDYRKPTLDISAETELINDFDTLLNQDAVPFISDTVVFANGPKSYLFHGVHHETYLTYALSYAIQLDQLKQEN